MPSGTRISEPVSTGVAVSSPNCVAFRSSIFLIGMPITANIIQIAKHTVNASVLMIDHGPLPGPQAGAWLCVAAPHCRHRGLLENSALACKLDAKRVFFMTHIKPRRTFDRQRKPPLLPRG